MNLQEAEKNIGSLVISTDPGFKMISRLKAHGPYRIIKVTKAGYVQVDPSHPAHSSIRAAHLTLIEGVSENDGECKCPCHDPNGPRMMHFMACCQGKCPGCGRYFKCIESHKWVCQKNIGNYSNETPHANLPSLVLQRCGEE